jgi:hypothetical protein
MSTTDTGHFALEPHVDVIAEHIDKLMTSLNR